jgi:hypothetical protein
MQEEMINTLVQCVEDLKAVVKEQSTMTKPSYTNEEVLRIFGVTNPTLRKWRNEGLLGYSQIGSTYAYSQKDIEDFLQKHHYEAFA